MKPIFFALLASLFILSACAGPGTLAPPPALDHREAASQVLSSFFEALNRSDYAAAARLYGGSYETLATMNPDIPADDHVALWKQGCQFNGLQCLKIKEILLSEQVDENTFHFIVKFQNADGSLFTQGPCCGEDETSMPPVSEFGYEVRRNANGQLQVMDMPPYVP
jgi:hypothetical protein